MKNKTNNPNILTGVNLKEYECYTGELQIHFETGMEQIGLILYQNDPKFVTKNLHYNPRRPDLGPEFFHNYEAMVLLESGDLLFVDNSFYKIGNNSLSKKYEYRLSAFPMVDDESLFNIQQWAALFKNQKEAKLYRKIKKMKSAFFGGSFDPIHHAHEEMISELNQRFDKVFLMVSYNWTKQNSLYSFEQRNAALKIIGNKYPKVQVLEWGKNEDTSSSYIMVKKIKEKFGVNPYIVIGSDNAKNINQWKYWENLKNECNFVIFKRDDIEIATHIPDPLIINWKTKYNGLSSTKIREQNLLEMIPQEVRSIFGDSK